MFEDIEHLIEIEEKSRSEVISDANDTANKIKSLSEQLAKINQIIVFKNGRIAMLRDLIEKQNGSDLAVSMERG